MNCFSLIEIEYLNIDLTYVYVVLEFDVLFCLNLLVFYPLRNVDVNCCIKMIIMSRNNKGRAIMGLCVS